MVLNNEHCSPCQPRRVESGEVQGQMIYRLMQNKMRPGAWGAYETATQSAVIGVTKTGTNGIRTRIEQKAGRLTVCLLQRVDPGET